MSLRGALPRSDCYRARVVASPNLLPAVAGKTEAMMAKTISVDAKRERSTFLMRSRRSSIRLREGFDAVGTSPAIKDGDWASSSASA